MAFLESDFLLLKQREELLRDRERSDGKKRVVAEIMISDLSRQLSEEQFLPETLHPELIRQLLQVMTVINDFVSNPRKNLSGREVAQESKRGTIQDRFNALASLLLKRLSKENEYAFEDQIPVDEYTWLVSAQRRLKGI